MHCKINLKSDALCCGFDCADYFSSSQAVEMKVNSYNIDKVEVFLTELWNWFSMNSCKLTDSATN